MLNDHFRQRGLACCDSWGHKESDTTELLNKKKMLVEKVENHWKISKCLKNVYDFKNTILDIHRKRIVFDMWVCVYVILFNLGPILPLRH